MKKFNDSLFIRIEFGEELELKKEMLRLKESLVESQTLLEDLKDIKEKKRSLQVIVKEKIRNLIQLLDKLDSLLPKPKEEIKPKIKEKKKKERKIKKKEKITSIKKTKKLELRKELETIREKLKTLES